jgi:hypothetical protein
MGKPVWTYSTAFSANSPNTFVLQPNRTCQKSCTSRDLNNIILNKKGKKGFKEDEKRFEGGAQKGGGGLDESGHCSSRPQIISYYTVHIYPSSPLDNIRELLVVYEPHERPIIGLKLARRHEGKVRAAEGRGWEVAASF